MKMNFSPKVRCQTTSALALPRGGRCLVANYENNKLGMLSDSALLFFPSGNVYLQEVSYFLLPSSLTLASKRPLYLPLQGEMEVHLGFGFPGYRPRAVLSA